MSRYPYIATEVLCSEIWSIVEACTSRSSELLLPFWDSILDTSPGDMMGKINVATHFVKINAIFLSKKPDEVCAAASGDVRVSPSTLSDVRIHPIRAKCHRQTTQPHSVATICRVDIPDSTVGRATRQSGCDSSQFPYFGLTHILLRHIEFTVVVIPRINPKALRSSVSGTETRRSPGRCRFPEGDHRSFVSISEQLPGQPYDYEH